MEFCLTADQSACDMGEMRFNRVNRESGADQLVFLQEHGDVFIRVVLMAPRKEVDFFLVAVYTGPNSYSWDFNKAYVLDASNASE